MFWRFISQPFPTRPSPICQKAHFSFERSTPAASFSHFHFHSSEEWHCSHCLAMIASILFTIVAIHSVAQLHRVCRKIPILNPKRNTLVSSKSVRESYLSQTKRSSRSVGKYQFSRWKKRLSTNRLTGILKRLCLCKQRIFWCQTPRTPRWEISCLHCRGDIDKGKREQPRDIFNICRRNIEDQHCQVEGIFGVSWNSRSKHRSLRHHPSEKKWKSVLANHSHFFYCFTLVQKFTH